LCFPKLLYSTLCWRLFFYSLLVFINFFIFFLSLGIFYIYGNLSSSSLTNSTFTSITHVYNGNGGAIYIQTPNYSSITINRCVFTQCKVGYGGALCLGFDTLYINIRYTRFENNSAKYGNDIYVNTSSSCFNLATKGSGSLDSSVCSTTPHADRLNCGGDTSQSLSDCLKDVV
jgi:hypothetical protein